MSQNIFIEDTVKLKTKVLIFGSVSLFVGVSKTLPTEISVIGMNLKGKECFVGWFLFVITSYLLIHFLILAILDIVKFFKKDIVNVKAKKFTGDTLGYTYDEIGEEYDRQHEYDEPYQDEDAGTLSREVSDINRKIKALEERFDTLHLSVNNYISVFTSLIIPVVLGITGLSCLYCFLMTLA